MVQDAWMEKGLHDLCQPLTALQCRLFLGTLAPEHDVDELRLAIRESMVQCERLVTQVRRLQMKLGEDKEDA